MCQANPQMRAILTNPDMMREIMTPQNMAAAMGMMQGGGPGGMGAMGGMPGSMPMPGSAGQEHLGKKIEIGLNQILRVLSQFTNDENPNDIWYIKKIQNANVLEKFMHK